jgi:hypothetical protein
MLKRLADAERDGDRIYGLIHGVAINNDGGGAGPIHIWCRMRGTEAAAAGPLSLLLLLRMGSGLSVSVLAAPAHSPAARHE